MFDPNNPEKVIDNILKVFPNYMQLFRQVSMEYDRTPEWRMIRKMRLLNQMHRINVRYNKWFEKAMNPVLKVEVKK